MGRKRFIAPEFFTHGELFDAEQKSGLPLRMAYAGLWTASDRRGLFWWKPRELKLAILPYDDVDFEMVLSTLEDHNFVERYVVDGKAFGYIPAMSRWQSFHKNEQPSDVPDPAIGRREPSKLGPKPSPSIAVAVSTTGTVTTKQLTGNANALPVAERVAKLVPDSGTPAKKPKATKPPAFPNFAREQCDAMWNLWTTTFGAIDYGRFRRTFGPLFSAPESERCTDAELLAALKSYADLAPMGDGARFANANRAAECLAAIATARRDHAENPEARSDAVMRIIHGQRLRKPA